MALLASGAREGKGKGPGHVCGWAASCQRPKEWCGRLAGGQRIARGCVSVLIGVVAVVFFASVGDTAWCGGLVGEHG